MSQALGWQDAIVVVAMIVALAWLVRNWLTRRRRPTPLCGDCPKCAPGRDRLNLE